MFWKYKQRLQQWLTEERGTIRKDWGGKVRVALAFPNRYAIGMSNLGFQSVYGALNALDYVVCERVFYPEPDDLAFLRENPGKLLALESQRPVADFHLLAFSIPFENDYPNVLEMLHLSGIPAHSEARTLAHPLVAAGGVAIFLNPEVLAPFMDFFFIGEAEALLPDFWEQWNAAQAENAARREFLQTLAAQVPGIYVPALYAPSYREDGTLAELSPIGSAPARVRYRRADFATTRACQTVVLTPNTEFGDVTLLEIGRGCGRGCRFCAAGFVYRPMRTHPAEALVAQAQPALDQTPRIGLVSAAVSDHPQITSLCDSLLGLGGELSFSSLRADTITPQIIGALQSSAHQSVAIAPEAGSERLRAVINKNLDREQIYTAAALLTEKGIIHLKLYFMIGLPTETLEDLEAIVELTKGIKHHVLTVSRGQRRLGTITLSIHGFVPKPFTPFQWVPFAGIQELKNRARWIQRALQKVANVRVHFDLPKWAYVQALLARGDRRVALMLEKVALEGLSWSQAMRQVPVNPDFWVMRERGADERFPWEILDMGVRRSYLWEEYQRALAGRKSPPCDLSVECKRCGVCTL